MRTKSYPDFEGFEIVRREVIGTVEPSATAVEGPLPTAFRLIGKYLEDNDHPQGVHLEFEVFGRTFSADLKEDPNYTKWREEHSDDGD